jgi:hypothetical protein
MTPEQHNKYVGIAQLVYAATYCLFLILILFMFGAMIFTLSNNPQADAPPPAVFLIFAILIVAFNSVFIIPSFVAGYGLLKRRSWAKVWAIIAAIFASMFPPFGTAAAIYTFWFIFSEPGKLLYDKPSPALPPAPPTWSSERELLSTPVSKPPDWR